MGITRKLKNSDATAPAKFKGSYLGLGCSLDIGTIAESFPSDVNDLDTELP